MTFEDPNNGQYGSPGYFPPPPGYPPATYPGQPAYGYPAQTPGYPQPAYPTYPGYPAYAGQLPIYPADPNRRPGLVTASAVLAYIEAGLLMFAAFFLFMGSSTTDSVSSDFASNNDVTTKFVLLGLANVVAGILYLVGGIQATSRRRVGRTLMLFSTAIVILLGLIWLTWAGNAAVFWALLYWVLSLVSAGLVLGSPVSRWLAGRGVPVGPPPAQYPSY